MKGKSRGYKKLAASAVAEHWYDGPISKDMMFASIIHPVPVLRKIVEVESDPRYTQRKVWTEMMQEGPIKGLKSWMFERQFRQSQQLVPADV